ncbi:AtpZ/AtpI family protein [Sphingobacterium suaedae]|uniref:AtpZ/AtpI family protein n=1 Tax=Sphingobacterium suaedae TaxID=1686402 RepID=A0ABW5KKX6_9SPHI
MRGNKGSDRKNKWLVFTSMPIQMGVTIYVFYRLGAWLDERYAVEGEWWMKGLTMLGVLVSMYQFIRQVNYLNKDE